MGKVVKLDTAAAERQGTAPRSGGTPRRRARSKSALVLGGGGFTGGVYEIGALRALDLLSVNRTVNEFDVYVGTSAGSFVAAAVANGVTPEEMMRVIVQQVPTSFPDARVS
ncbi:MAG: patatin-like phospholipase family protein, partial [Solirubrobacterales bacterium]|nr:patatin-like phospholipase family protein [Solirubrobacterales bacterium]